MKRLILGLFVLSLLASCASTQFPGKFLGGLSESGVTASNMKNIYASIPREVDREIFEDLIHSDSVRIERILSKGQSSPDCGWYDQDENEWVIVLQGAGTIVFEDGREVKLGKGDFLNIPKHQKHRVSWTDPDDVTVWLAIFYR